MPKQKKQLDQDESDNDQEQDSQNQLKVNTDNSPKIIPVAKLPDKLKYKKIVLNVSDTQYPIITQIGQQLGWIIQDQEGLGDWDVWWTDREIQPNTLYKMNLHQKINHFPGIYVLARKNLLGLHLMGMQKKFPNQYNFFPQTWMLPMQFPQFRQYFQSIQQGKVRTYIVKPEALSQGRGIFLTRNIQDVINGHKYVVQRYLKNPLLLDGLKFDLRIYVLLAGSQPLRLYIYEEGLARLATRPYQVPTAQNLHQNYIHLTNYSLNKTNPDYIYNKSDKQMDTGHKRSLKGVYQKLARSGIDIQKLKTQIQECIIKTVISGLPSIRHQYKYCQPQEYQGNMCFHILGFDVMILDDYKPIVIQVNHTPSFQTSTPLDYQIKKNLIKDTLKLMRITSKQKKSLFIKSKQLTKKRVQTGKRDILKGQDRTKHLQKIQRQRDEQQNQILYNSQKPNGYKAIFPFKDEKKNQIYAKLYQGAQKVMKQLKDMRKKIISEQNSTIKQQTKPAVNKNSPHIRNPSSVKQISSIQRQGNKKTSILNNISSSYKSSFSHNKCQNIQNSSNSNGSNQKSGKKIEYDTVLETNCQKNIAANSKQAQTSNKSEVYSSQKKIVYSSPGTTKGNFHIRNNAFSRKGSINSQGNQRHVFSPSLLQQQQMPKTQFNSNKFDELMEKFVKSKDFNTCNKQRISLQGQMILQQKLNACYQSKQQKKQNSYDISDSQNLEHFYKIKQKITRQKQAISKNQFYTVKGYKQKMLKQTPASHNKMFEKQKFHESHLVRQSQLTKIQNIKVIKSIRNETVQISKPSIRQNYLSQLQSQSIGLIDCIVPFIQKNSNNNNCNNRNENKLGKFLKPKTFNLHQSKFPQQDKYIVRTAHTNLNLANINGSHLQNQSLNTVYSPTVNITNNSHGLGTNFLQYDEYCTAINSNVITSNVPAHGYVGRNKIHVNQRQIGSYVNIKPSTSQKYKSNSFVYSKSNSNPPKDNIVLMKLIDKSKIKGYN